MKRLLNTKKISPLLVIIMTGAIGILLVSAGTAGFIVFQGQFLDKVEKQQQTYFNLVDFRDKVIDYGEKSLEKSMPEKAKEMEVLQFMHDRLTSEMGDACPRQDQFFPIPSSGNSKLILLQMQTAIDQVRAESRTAAEELVFQPDISLHHSRPASQSQHCRWLASSLQLPPYPYSFGAACPAAEACEQRHS